MAGIFHQEFNLKAGNKKPHRHKVRLQVRLYRRINNRSLSLFPNQKQGKQALAPVAAKRSSEEHHIF